MSVPVAEKSQHLSTIGLTPASVLPVLPERMESQVVRIGFSPRALPLTVSFTQSCPPLVSFTNVTPTSRTPSPSKSPTENAPVECSGGGVMCQIWRISPVVLSSLAMAMVGGVRCGKVLCTTTASTAWHVRQWVQATVALRALATS